MAPPRASVRAQRSRCWMLLPALGMLLLACNAELHNLGENALAAVDGSAPVGDPPEERAPPAAGVPVPERDASPPPGVQPAAPTQLPPPPPPAVPSPEPSAVVAPPTVPTASAQPPSQPPLPTSPVPEAGTMERAPLVARLPPNVFVEVLGVTQQQTDGRVQAIYDQLFRGAPENESILVQTENGAYVHDVLHNDTRAEALGYGMYASVLLNEQEIFGRIWSYTRTQGIFQDGSRQGLIAARCELNGGGCDPRVSQYGAAYIISSLIMASRKWPIDSATPNGGALGYEREARQLLERLQSQQVVLDSGAERGLFPEETLLPSRPEVAGDRPVVATPSLMPAFYEYWGHFSQDPFWTSAAIAARRFLAGTVHPTTGLIPRLSFPDGSAVPGSDQFTEECYGFLLALALDATWYGVDTNQVNIADFMLNFFGKPEAHYYSSDYDYDGSPSASAQNTRALTAAIDAVASISTHEDRAAFVRRSWTAPIPVGSARYFDGVLLLMANLHLAGRVQAP